MLCVAHGDVRWDHLQDVGDVPEHLLAEIKHFFEVYKDLEPGKESNVGGWTGHDEAVAAIEAARKAHAGQH